VKRKIEIELYEEYEAVNFYTVKFEYEKTEFDKFLDAFIDNPKYKRDIDRILSNIKQISQRGALERYFRNEGKYSDGVYALPVFSCKLRLYVLRISDEVLILGNGGIKLTATYNEDEKLNKMVSLLQLIEKQFKSRRSSKQIQIKNKTICGDVKFII